MNPQPSWRVLGATSFAAIAQGRLQTHHAVQWLSRVARSVLEPLPDDSHSSLSWDDEISGFASADLKVSGKSIQLCMNLANFTLSFADKGAGTVISEMPLDSRTDADVEKWLSRQLQELGFPSNGLQSELPYELDAVPDGLIEPYDAQATVLGRTELAKWYSNAVALFNELTSSITDVHPGPSPVRCWPHHYDIATLIGLELGDPETAKSVGVGLSPGDSVYDMPYFYVNPWPFPSAELQTDAPPPGKWHTDGFISIVLTADSLLSQGDGAQAASARGFVLNAYKLAAMVSGR